MGRVLTALGGALAGACLATTGAAFVLAYNRHVPEDGTRLFLFVATPGALAGSAIALAGGKSDLGARVRRVTLGMLAGVALAVAVALPFGGPKSVLPARIGLVTVPLGLALGGGVGYLCGSRRPRDDARP